MKKIHVEGGGFPGTSKTWRFIAEMIQQNADVASAIAGDNVIVSGCEVVNDIAADGIIIINGEMFPFIGGNVSDNPYITITENIETTQYLKDDDGDGQGDTIDTYFDRVAVLTDTLGTVQNPVYSFSGLTRLKSLKELSKRIPPMNSVIMYYGSIANIPEGWQLCNGTNGTPDLSGKFIVGYDSTVDDYNAIGNTGGEKKHTLTVDEMPQHNHNGNTSSNGNHRHGFELNNNNNGEGLPALEKGNSYQGTNFNTEYAGSHNHSFTTNNRGGGQSHENRPPYFTLAYITYVG